MVPAALPAISGENVTVKDVVLLAGMVSGNEMPPSENPGPFQLAV
jgi:hypothetical protein